MRKLILLACIVCSLQAVAQSPTEFFKLQKQSYSRPITSLVIYVDTLTCPVGLTVMYDLSISGEKKSGKKTIAYTNTDGVYSINKNLTPTAISGAKFEVLLINNKVIVVLTLTAKAKTNWVYNKTF